MTRHRKIEISGSCHVSMVMQISFIVLGDVCIIIARWIYASNVRDSGPKDAQPPRILLLTPNSRVSSRWKVRNWQICLQNSKFIRNTSLEIYLECWMTSSIVLKRTVWKQFWSKWVQQSHNFNRWSHLSAGESPSRSAKVATNHLPKLCMSHARGCCRNLWIQVPTTFKNTSGINWCCVHCHEPWRNFGVQVQSFVPTVFNNVQINQNTANRTTTVDSSEGNYRLNHWSHRPKSIPKQKRKQRSDKDAVPWGGSKIIGLLRGPRKVGSLIHKVPQSCQTESLGFPSYPLPLDTPP